MALQSAMSATPLEKFCTEDEMSDEDRFSLRLSDGEEEDTEKNETQKTDKTASSESLETEEEILDKFAIVEPEPSAAVDEDALLNEKQKDIVLKEKETNNDEAAPVSNCEDASKDVTKEIEQKTEKKDHTEKGDVSEKEDTNQSEEKEDSKMDQVAQSEKESNLDTVQMDTDDLIEESTRPDDALNTVSKDFKDTMDTEDLLQVTSVKEADAANENSSSASSEKDDLEESVDPSNEDTNEREEDDNEELIERPPEGVDCGDMVDIEENNPLGDEVSEEMNKDYENLLNSEKESADAEVSEKTVKENGENNTNANEDKQSGDAEESISKETLSAKVGDVFPKNESHEKTDNPVESNDSDENIQCRSSENLFTQNAPLNGVAAEEADRNSTKSVKRSLSECETEIGSKKIRLTPSPVQAEKKIVVLQTLADFMKTKSMRKLSRRHLEEFCIQKMCEVLIHKSEIGELRHQLHTQEQMMDFWKKETTAMAKQVKDLEIVNKKMLNELKLRQEKDTPPVPVKITRSVGLQVKLETISAKRISRSGSEVSHISQSPSKSIINNATKATPKAISPQIANRSVKETAATPSSTLLSQALTKEQLPNNATSSSVSGAATATTDSSTTTSTEPKGVIDLTDEDEKASNNAYVSNTILAVPQTKTQTTTTVRTTPISSIAIVASKPSTTGVATSTTPRFMYVLQPNPQIPQTVTGDLSKSGPTKAVMLKLPNGVIGPTNGIIPALQNGSSTICSLPQTALRAGQVRLQSPTPSNVIRNKNIIRHPAPLPPPPTATVTVSRKPIPPKPQLSIRKSGQGIVLSWKLPFPLDNYEIIASYQLYAYQETSSPPNSEMWRKVGDVKALALPMACTLTQFADGNKYYFAVRAVDICKRIGPFSDPEPISL